MLLAELSTLLTASTYFTNVDSTTSVPVWLGTTPDGVANTCITLYESPGVGPSFTYSGLAFERPRVQVVARSSSYTKSVEVGDKAKALLTLTESTLSGVRYVSITPVQHPYDMGGDALGNHLRSCNYAIERQST